MTRLQMHGKFAILHRSNSLHQSSPWKLGLVLASAIVLASGCGKSSETATSSPSPTTSVSNSSPSDPATPSSPNATNSPNAANSTLISSTGIGAAQLGMTLGALKDTLGSDAEFTVESPFIVDFDAIAVHKDGKVLYYILYLAGANFGDEDVIQGLLTENPQFKTAEGVGAGTTLADAEAAYGKATLSYNTQNESREYARFEKQPANNLSFATGNGNQNLAGIYSSPTGEYNETKEYRPDATIQSVLVVCLNETCAPPAAK